jgi:hypothetical protein
MLVGTKGKKKATQEMPSVPEGNEGTEGDAGSAAAQPPEKEMNDLLEDKLIAGLRSLNDEEKVLIEYLIEILDKDKQRTLKNLVVQLTEMRTPQVETTAAIRERAFQTAKARRTQTVLLICHAQQYFPKDADAGRKFLAARKLMLGEQLMLGELTKESTAAAQSLIQDVQDGIEKDDPAKKALKEANKQLRNILVLLIRSETTEMKDRDEFISVLSAAYTDLDFDAEENLTLRATLLLAYDKEMKKAGETEMFPSNNSTRPKRKARGHKQASSSDGHESAHEKDPMKVLPMMLPMKVIPMMLPMESRGASSSSAAYGAADSYFVDPYFYKLLFSSDSE